jgi:hypothetical protein
MKNWNVECQRADRRGGLSVKLNWKKFLIDRFDATGSSGRWSWNDRLEGNFGFDIRYGLAGNGGVSGQAAAGADMGATTTGCRTRPAAAGSTSPSAPARAAAPATPRILRTASAR